MPERPSTILIYEATEEGDMEALTDLLAEILADHAEQLLQSAQTSGHTVSAA